MTNSMKAVSILGGVAMLLPAGMAFANVDVQDIGTLVNNTTSAEVSAGEQFDLTFTADATNGDEIEYVRARARDNTNHILSTSCTNVGRKTGDDVELTAQVTTPSDTPQGNIDILIDVYGNPGVSQHDGCTGSSLDNYTFLDIVRVGDNTNDGQSSSGSGSSSSGSSALDKLKAMIDALTAQLTGLTGVVTGLMPDAVCAQKPADTMSLQNFLVGQGFMTSAQVATGPGVYGPRTTAAVSAFNSAHKCK